MIASLLRRLRVVARPVGGPVLRWLDHVRQERFRARFGATGAGVTFGRSITVIGGDRIVLAPGVRLMDGAYLWATPEGRIEIGDRTYVGEHVHLVANDHVSIGRDVLLAPFCYIQDTDHGFARLDIPIAAQPSNSSPIVIEDDVWLGAHTVVTRGVTIGRGAVVGANSVVTHDVAPYDVVAGSPARVIRSRRT